jgi:hypothetical protein
MAYASIIPFLVILWAPPEPATAPAAEPEAAPPGDAAAPEGEGVPEDAPPGDDDAPPGEGSEAAPGAADPTTLGNPFDAPAPTVVAPTPPPPPTPIPPPARPIRWRLDIAPGIGATIVKDLGFRALAWNRTLLDVDASMLFDFRVANSRFFVGGGLAYAFARRIGYAYEGALYPEVRLHEPRVLGRASFMTIEGVDVFARVGVGPSIVRLDFESSYGDWEDYESTNFGYHLGEQGLAVLPRLDGQAGLSLYLPKHLLPRRQASRITAGLELGLGYVWRGKLAAEPVLDTGEDSIRGTPANWGELSLHGLAWSARLFLRVM